MACLFLIFFCELDYTLSTAVQVSPIRRQAVYLPNKLLCDPVRTSVSTSTSSSMR